MAEQRARIPVGPQIGTDWARTAGKLAALGVGSALFGALWLGPTLRSSLDGRQIAAQPVTPSKVKPTPKPKDPVRPVVTPGKPGPDGKPLQLGQKPPVAKPPVPKPNPVVTPPPVPPTPGRPVPPEHTTQPDKPEPAKPVPPTPVPSKIARGPMVYRVWLGQFANRDEAEAFRKKLVTDVNHPAMPTLFTRPDGQITVQAGAFRKADGALRMVESYRQRGYQPEAVAEQR